MFGTCLSLLTPQVTLISKSGEEHLDPQHVAVNPKLTLSSQPPSVSGRIFLGVTHKAMLSAGMVPNKHHHAEAHTHILMMKLHLHLAAGTDNKITKSDVENKVNVSRKPIGGMWSE